MGATHVLDRQHPAASLKEQVAHIAQPSIALAFVTDSGGENKVLVVYGMRHLPRPRVLGI